MDNHLSSPPIAQRIERVSTCGRIALYAYLLAADRVYLLRMLPCVAAVSYTAPFTLTPHLFIRKSNKKVRGGIVSVALSLGLPPAAVSGYRILRCPDFPLVPYAGNERSSN